MENMKLWDLVSVTDKKDTKSFKGKGGFNGTAICAQTQKKKACEVFGMFGTEDGWNLENQKYSILEISNDFHHNLLVYSAILKYDFEGVKGSINIDSEIDIWNYIKKYSDWVKNNDIHKKVRTDAITKGLSELGFNSDVFEGKFDDNKYMGQTGNGSPKPKNNLPPLSEKSDNEKGWLNHPSKNYDDMLELMKKGYDIFDIRSQFKVSKDIAAQLEKDLSRPAQPKEDVDLLVIEMVEMVKKAGIEKGRFQAWLKETYPNLTMKEAILNNNQEIKNIITGNPDSIINLDGLPF
jgi:hypothetical protein